MEDLFQRYVVDMPVTARAPVPSEGNVIILTDSTGSLGSYLLDCLSSTQKVNHIICLNPSKDAADSQKRIHEDRGLTSSFGSKVTFIQCDFAAPYLDLSIPTYLDLLKSVTHILHNAWPVNFNLSLDSFADTHIHGVRQLIDFSARSTHGAAIYFLSTVGTVQDYSFENDEHNPATPRQAPERIFPSWSTSRPMGYASSKHISERLLDAASLTCNQSTTICRLGQIAGPVLRGEKGKWGLQEWFPSLIVSSAYLGVIPESLGRMEMIDWVPVDLCAEIVVGLCLEAGTGDAGTGKGATVQHVVNPRTTSWRSLLPALLEAFQEKKRPTPVLLDRWVDALKDSIGKESHGASSSNPAVKLLPFFEWMAEGDRNGVGLATMLDTRATAESNERLKKLQPVGERWVGLWMRQWGL